MIFLLIGSEECVDILSKVCSSHSAEFSFLSELFSNYEVCIDKVLVELVAKKRFLLLGKNKHSAIHKVSFLSNADLKISPYVCVHMKAIP